MSLKLSHTGSIIKEYLEEANISQKELSKRTGYSEKHISKVLNGNARLTEEFAIKLEKIISYVPASYWLNYESKYREQLARDKEIYELKNLDLENVSKKFHFKEVFNGLDMTIQEQAIEMLKLLKISSFSQFETTYNELNFNFMEDGGEKEAIVIWLNLCEEEIEIQNNIQIVYKEENLRKNLNKFKILALNNNIDKSMISCKKMCNKLGINLVIMEAIRNCKVRGALTTYKDNPTIYLSGRFKTHDNIWFALMHEIGHLLYHYNIKGTILSYEDEIVEKENEANMFAREFFINSQEYNAFFDSHNIDEKCILEFAKTQKVLPGIVVARLQHDNKIAYHEFNYLKNR